MRIGLRLAAGGASRPPSRMPRVKLTGRKVSSVCGDALAASRLTLSAGLLGAPTATRTERRAAAGATAIAASAGAPGGMPARALGGGGGGGGRPLAGERSVGREAAPARRGWSPAQQVRRRDAAAPWRSAADFRRVLEFGEARISRPAISLRSRLMRRCSSRSCSYCSSLRPALPTQSRRRFTWAPGAIRSTLVGLRSRLGRVPGSPASRPRSPMREDRPQQRRRRRRDRRRAVAHWRCLRRQPLDAASFRRCLMACGHGQTPWRIT